MYRSINLMLINLTGNYFVLRRLLDFIAQSFYAISHNDVGVENRNNDTGMCGPMKANIRDVRKRYTTCLSHSRHHSFIWILQLDVPLHSLLIIIHHSSHSAAEDFSKLTPRSTTVISSEVYIIHTFL